MTTCNRCGARMIPDPKALVPALKCVGCGRLIPLTGVRAAKVDRASVNRALRAARRRGLR